MQGRTDEAREVLQTSWPLCVHYGLQPEWTDDAALLAVPARSPLLLVERLSHTYGDRPVELRRGLYHTEHHHYRNLLS